jgi:hypothetical protein
MLALAPAAAQEAADSAETEAVIAELDSAISGQQDEAGALFNAKQRSDDGDLIAAAAILEAYLLIDEESIGARVEYAALLCQLDDRQAADFELAKLAAIGIDPDSSARLDASCGTTPDAVTL